MESQMSSVYIFAVLIMKNEESNIKNLIENMSKYVDGFCLQDNGSTDDSVKVARDALEKSGKIYKLVEDKWYSYGQNRNMCIETCHELIKDFVTNVFGVDIRKPLTRESFDIVDNTRYYFFINDIDNNIIDYKKKFNKGDFTKSGYYIPSVRGDIQYKTQNIVRADPFKVDKWYFSRRVHEFVSPIYPHYNKEDIDLYEAIKIDYGTKGERSRDPNTSFKDLCALADDNIQYGEDGKKDPRSRFYMAQSMRGAGLTSSSNDYYLEHARSTDSAYEERYYSYYTLAGASERGSKKFFKYINEGMNLRCNRLELVHMLNLYYVDKQLYKLGFELVSNYLDMEVNYTSLFLNIPVNEYMFQLYAGISCYYSGNYKEAKKIWEKGLKSPSITPHIENRIKENMKFLDGKL